jgi:hypothetical protein
MGGLFLLGGLGSVVVLFFPVILVLALLVILALRHDDDADGNRAPAIYGSVIAYVGLLTVLFSATGVVAALVELTNDNSYDDDGTVTTAVIFLIAGLAALGLLRVHQGLFARRHTAGEAAHRVHRAYVLVMCLTVALTAMVAGGILLYQLYGVAFPDTAGTDRGDAFRVAVTMAVLFLGSAGLWQRHWRELDLGGPVEVSAGGGAA